MKHHTIAIVLSLAAFASAQVQDLPKCATLCFTKAIGATTCAPTDAHCACTVGAADFMKVAIPCLCESGCTAEDLKKVEVSTNNLCAAALSAKGEEYTPATLDPKVCEAVKKGGSGVMTMTGTGTMSLTSATGTATGTASGTETGTATATASETAVPEATGGANGGFMVEGVVVGMAVVGLVLM